MDRDNILTNKLKSNFWTTSKISLSDNSSYDNLPDEQKKIFDLNMERQLMLDGYMPEGIRNVSIAECPKEAPSRMINSGTSGVEPWMIEAIKPRHYSPQEQLASCKLNVIEDSVDNFFNDIDYHIHKTGGLGAVLAPGHHSTDNAIIIQAAARSVMDGQITCFVAKNREPKTHFNLKGTMTYNLSNVLISCTPLAVEEKDTKKPPVGRSQKQHNLIQAMNTKGKR